MFLCNLPNHCGSKKLLSAPGSSAFSIYFFFFYLKDKSERNLCSFSPFFADQNIYGSHCGEKKKVSLPGSLRCCDPLLASPLTLSADSLHNSQSVLTSTDECEYCIHSVAGFSLFGL